MGSASEEFKVQIDQILSSHLKTLSESISAIETEQSERGQYRSGATIRRFAQAISDEAEKFLDSALEELDVFVDQIHLDLHKGIDIVRYKSTQIVLKALELKSIERLQMSNAKPDVKFEIMKLARTHTELNKAKIRRRSIGLRSDSNGASTTVNFSAQTVSGTVQFGDSNTATQNNRGLDLDSALKLISSIEGLRAIKQADTDQVIELRAELETLKAQLKKKSPSDTIISETLRSIRSITEGLAGNALAIQLAPLVASLRTALGG